MADEQTQQGGKPDDWLQIARDAYTSSTSYMDANYRRNWEDAIRMFQSRHPADSKYNSETYKFRSKIFRPKTRSVIRKVEAAGAAAFFSNVDVVNVEPVNQKAPEAAKGAQLYKELIQYRLTKTIPWFVVLLGALQEAQVIGVVASYQGWKYRERRVPVWSDAMDEYGQPVLGEDGQPMQMQTGERVEVLEDRPCVDLIPPENLRIDPAASWADPIGTSPYIIHLIPMYVQDVRAMARDGGQDKTGYQRWAEVSEGELRAATNQAYDSTRQTREGQREDPKTNQTPITDMDIVWVHRNIVRRDGEDWCYYTLGIEKLLSDPVPMREMYLHGERPYVMGISIIEAHKTMPDGSPMLGRELQKEVNEVVNTRLDNVKLVLNKRYIVKRGAQVDLKSLVRNVAGSITLANDPTGDVKQIEFNDVTASAFAEQDRLNVDFDELLGNFSSSSVMTNRKLGETVGGMGIIASGANQMTEYTLRTFTETWVEPVLRQLVKLERYYETDETILALMGEKLDTQITDEMFDTDVSLNVSVGMGATDPVMKMNRLLAGVQAFANVAAGGAPGLNLGEIGKEIFGYMGYRDGGRFLTDGEDPKAAAMQAQMQKMGQMIQQLQDQLRNRQAEIALRASKQSADEAAQNRQALLDLEELMARVDLLQAQTVEALTKAGVPASAALLTLAGTPEPMPAGY